MQFLKSTIKKIGKVSFFLWFFCMTILLISYKTTGWFFVSSFDISDDSGNLVTWNELFAHLPQMILISTIITSLAFYLEWKSKKNKKA